MHAAIESQNGLCVALVQNYSVPIVGLDDNMIPSNGEIAPWRVVFLTVTTTFNTKRCSNLHHIFYQLNFKLMTQRFSLFSVCDMTINKEFSEDFSMCVS